MHVSDPWIPFLLTLMAGLATGIGSTFAFLGKRADTAFLSFSLGFSAGVMLYVSFVEIFAKARFSLTMALGPVHGTWLTTASFFSGIAFIAMIDRLVPSMENPHEIRRVSDMDNPAKAMDFNRLYRMGLFTALAIAIHNFPEGLATFTAALQDPSLGFAIATAIAIHNIPEGVAVAVPVFYATGSRKKAFFYSLLSGLSEPLGALIGYVLLLRFFSEVTFGITFAAVGGIMVFISLDELLPAAEEFGRHHTSMYGLIAGMALMALSLLLFL